MGWHPAAFWHHGSGTFSPIICRSTCCRCAWGRISCSSTSGDCKCSSCHFPSSSPLSRCLVLAIYNTNFHLLVNHPSAHYPTQLPNSIHTASSLLALSAHFSLGCSISWITNFQFLQISLDTLAHGDGYLTLTPIVCVAPTLGGYSLALILILTMLEKISCNMQYQNSHTFVLRGVLGYVPFQYILRVYSSP